MEKGWLGWPGPTYDVTFEYDVITKYDINIKNDVTTTHEFININDYATIITAYDVTATDDVIARTSTAIISNGIQTSDVRTITRSWSNELPQLSQLIKSNSIHLI